MPNFKSYRVEGIPYDLKMGIATPAVPPNLKVAMKDLVGEYDYVVLDVFHTDNFRNEKTM